MIIKKITLTAWVFTLLLFFQANTAEASESVKIHGNGVEKVLTLDRATLEATAGKERHVYTHTNNFPSDKTEYAEGIPLENVLKLAGYKPEATLIKVTASDGYSRTFTCQELLNDPRYSFNGSSQARVPALIQLKGSAKSFNDLADKELMLILGQRVKGEQTSPWMVKYLADIEVTTEKITSWEAVTFTTGLNEQKQEVLELGHKNYDLVKIYYTTDESEPTINSKIYNVSASYYQPQLNVPLPIKAGLKVKAIAVGAGHSNSEVALWNAGEKAVQFNDLAGFEWAQDAIKALGAKGIISGIAEGEFAPQQNLTRAMFVTMLGREMAKDSQVSNSASTFSDIEAGSWYEQHVNWAVSKGIVYGYQDGTFKPHTPLTVEEMVAMVVRASGEEQQALNAEQNLIAAFAKETRISTWARPYIAYAQHRGLLEQGHLVKANEQGFFINGTQNANRAEAAVTLKLLFKL